MSALACDEGADDSSSLDSPTLPQSTASAPHHLPDERADFSSSQHSAFFRLPIELRNTIYRFFVLSPLSQSPNCSLYRPLSVDEVIFRIGYFKRDTVLPLLLTCRQIHIEASSILYSENIFVFHVSNLADDQVPFLDLLSPGYLRCIRNAYLRTEYLLPWPLEAYKDTPATSGDSSSMSDRDEALARLELEGSKKIATRAVPVWSGFIVNCEDTVEASTGDWIWTLQRDPTADCTDTSWPSSCQLWKMIMVDCSKVGIRQEFRRIERPSYAEIAKEPNENFDPLD